MFLEGIKEVENVHHNILPSKEGKYLVLDEVVNDDQIIRDANPVRSIIRF